VRAALDERGGRFARFAAGPRLPWSDADALGPAFDEQLARFLAEAGARAEGWAVLFCAGASVVASGRREVDADLAAFTRFLDGLARTLAASGGAPARRGFVLLASSAGGVWAGHRGPAIGESTPPCPIADYGRGQLAREEALAAFGARIPGIRSAAVRLSNLYGPGQRLDKPQGLVSQIARAVILRQPVHIYVPFDTVRDYLFAADAGRGMADVLERLAQSPEEGPRPLLKLLASEQDTTVGGLLNVFRLVTRRRVPVVAGLSPLGLRQPLRLRFRSEVWTSAGRGRSTPLLEGVARVHRDLLARHARGELGPARAA
jgi:UDP-glucose 4-epimerase